MHVQQSIEDFVFAFGLSFPSTGILVSPAVLPVASCLTWKKATKAGAIMGSIFGMLLGISAWLITCQAYYGSVRDRVESVVVHNERSVNQPLHPRPNKHRSTSTTWAETTPCLLAT